MADAVLTNVRTVAPQPTVPSRRPTQKLTVDFDGTGVKSVAIEKSLYGVTDFILPGGTPATTTIITFEVSIDGVNYRVLAGVSWDVTVDDTFNTSLMAGYDHYKIVQNLAENLNVDVGMVG
jgi:hypothetical protein